MLAAAHSAAWFIRCDSLIIQYTYDIQSGCGIDQDAVCALCTVSKPQSPQLHSHGFAGPAWAHEGHINTIEFRPTALQELLLTTNPTMVFWEAFGTPYIMPTVSFACCTIAGSGSRKTTPSKPATMVCSSLATTLKRPPFRTVVLFRGSSFNRSFTCTVT